MKLLSMKVLLGTTLLMLVFVWNNSIHSEQAIAVTKQVRRTQLTESMANSGLVPAPSLQREAPEILTVTEIDLPPQIQTAVLEAAAKRTSKPVSTLNIVKAQPKNWSDGCLGLAEPDELCTQVITPGWQVVVTDGLNNWIYRTNELGNLIKLEKSP